MEFTPIDLIQGRFYPLEDAWQHVWKYFQFHSWELLVTLGGGLRLRLLSVLTSPSCSACAFSAPRKPCPSSPFRLHSHLSSPGTLLRWLPVAHFLLSFLSFQAPLTSVLSRDTAQMPSGCSFSALLWTRKPVEAVGKTRSLGPHASQTLMDLCRFFYAEKVEKFICKIFSVGGWITAPQRHPCPNPWGTTNSSNS